MEATQITVIFPLSLRLKGNYVICLVWSKKQELSQTRKKKIKI